MIQSVVRHDARHQRSEESLLTMIQRVVIISRASIVLVAPITPIIVQLQCTEFYPAWS